MKPPKLNHYKPMREHDAPRPEPLMAGDLFGTLVAALVFLLLVVLLAAGSL